MKKVLSVSKKIWIAMQNKDETTLKTLIHPEAVFVHMSRTLVRDEEIGVITGTSSDRPIVYKHIDFKNQTVHEMGATIILLNQLTLTAVVAGNEVVNPFLVTEVYTNENDELKLASLSFTKITY